jgi:hypothetical protein
MIRLKKKLSDEEVEWIIDELNSRFEGEEIKTKTSKLLQTKLYKFVKTLEECSPKPKKKSLVKRSDITEVFDPSPKTLLEGEVIFNSLRELLEFVREKKQLGLDLKQYTNPISQLTGYASDDGSKYVVSIVDLRKDPRADSFTFNPMKLLLEVEDE